jgi:uncharacterized protein
LHRATPGGLVCPWRMEIFAWCLTALLMFIGLAGVIVPLLPGTALILFAAILHKLIVPDIVSWMTIFWIGVIFLVSVAADFGGVLLGTKWFGGGKWGMAGAGTGALVGMFVSLPALIFGTIFGAIAAEKLIAKKTGRASLLAGVGAATGFLLSTGARLICAVAMIALFVIAAIPAAR